MKNKHLIMIVEDEKAIIEFISVKLELQGYRTLKAVNGQEAISFAASFCPDLILLDLGLPDMDGTEVLEALRKWSLVPVIIISARHEEKFIVSTLDSGADDYITKPFNNQILMARIRTALRVNVANLRRKIEKDTANPQYILTEIGVGYRMLEEEQQAVT